MLYLIIYLLPGIPGFIFLATLLHYRDCPAELKKLALSAFVLAVPAILFLGYAAYLNQTPPYQGGYEGLSLLFRFGLPASAISFVIYVIVRVLTDRGWGKELLAAVGSLFLSVLFPLLIVGT